MFSTREAHDVAQNVTVQNVAMLFAATILSFQRAALADVLKEALAKGFLA